MVSEEQDNDLDFAAGDRRGSPERMIGAIVLSLAISAVLGWILTIHGFGWLLTGMIVWLTGNIAFIGALAASAIILRARDAQTLRKHEFRAAYQRLAAESRRNPTLDESIDQYGGRRARSSDNQRGARHSRLA